MRPRLPARSEARVKAARTEFQRIFIQTGGACDAAKRATCAFSWSKIRRRSPTVFVLCWNAGGMRSMSHPTATTAYDLCCGAPYDAAIIDVVLPERRLRAVAAMRAPKASRRRCCAVDCPRCRRRPRVAGSMPGADDYVVKPFVEDELAARCARCCGARRFLTGPTIAVGDLIVDRGARSVRVAGARSALGRDRIPPARISGCNAGLALTRAQILGRVWGEDFDGSSNVVDVYVSAVRRKLAAAGVRDRITPCGSRLLIERVVARLCVSYLAILLVVLIVLDATAYFYLAARSTISSNRCSEPPRGRPRTLTGCSRSRSHWRY